MRMKLIEYLSDVPSEEITQRLLKLFDGLWKVHNYNINNPKLYEKTPGFYFTKDLREVEVNEEGLYYIENAVDYIIDDESIKKKNWDIIELCIIGICAYDNISEYFNIYNDYAGTMNFIRSVRDKIDDYTGNAMVPPVMREYFIDVLVRSNYDYASNYYYKNYQDKELDGGRETGRVKTKSTPAGRAMAAMYDNNQNAYADVLLLPALLTLIYLVTFITYFIFFR